MYNSKKSALKYYKQGQYVKNSTGTLKYYPLQKLATSYDWWPLLKKFGKYTVFNYYNYSNTTAKHIHALSDHLRTTNVKVDIRISSSDNMVTPEVVVKALISENNLVLAKKFAKGLKVSYKPILDAYNAELKAQTEKKAKEKEEKRLKRLTEKELDKTWIEKDVVVNL